MIIAVDFDGTCVKHRYPMVGEDVDGAVSVLKELVRKGHKIILYTMRSGDTLDDAISWFIDNDIELWGINRNPEQYGGKTMPKIIICQGTRSSGKTDWTKQWVLKDPEHRVRFSDDDIRNMLGKHQAPEREVLVNAMRRQFIVAALKKCYDVVIDGTLKPHENDFVRRCVKAHNSTVDELRSLGKLSPQDDTRYSIEYKDSIVPLQESIGEDATTATYKKTYKFIGIW